MSNTYNEILEKIHDRDYKLTPQRQVILRIMLEHGHQHLSAEEVYNIVKREASEIGLATVYRTLELLAELEVLQKLNFDDGRSRYELNDREVHHHHHLVCIQCGRVMEFAEDLLEELEKKVWNESKFLVLDHQVKFIGLCQECQGKTEKDQ
ncbi:MAG: transcriptional repressor [Firmicutes bacterium]|nr:transcriptional repressor [Bacillota bacterium]MCL5040428.1 transcriptional repressor [Bacillota bacterium]